MATDGGVKTVSVEPDYDNMRAIFTCDFEGIHLPIALRCDDEETLKTYHGLVHCACMMVMCATDPAKLNEVRQQLTDAAGKLNERLQELEAAKYDHEEEPE